MYNKPNTYGPTVAGMLHKMKMLQAIASNISNANSIGYQRKIPESLRFPAILSDAIMRDPSQGQLKRTNNTLDFAIEGNAYFLVEGEEGPMPTKSGRLHLNEKGLLADADNREVVVIDKTDKALNIANDFDVEVKENGEIFVGKERYGRIALQILDNNPVKVHQGFLEMSNVNLMTEMMTLLTVFRNFEASEKTLGMETSVDKDLIEKYGRNV